MSSGIATQTPASTYADLLLVTNSNAGFDATPRLICSGSGGDGPVLMSNTALRIKNGGTLDGAVGAAADFTNIVVSNFLIDVIAERTADAGVTIDGCLIKDGAATLAATATSALSAESWTPNIETRTTGSSYTVVAEDDVILIDREAAFQVNLPAIVGANRTLTIKDSGLHANLNTITINPDGAETIDGESNLLITSRGQSVTLLDNGTEWVILSQYGGLDAMTGAGTMQINGTSAAGDFGASAVVVTPVSANDLNVNLTVTPIIVNNDIAQDFRLTIELVNDADSLVLGTLLDTAQIGFVGDEGTQGYAMGSGYTANNILVSSGTRLKVTRASGDINARYSVNYGNA